MIIDSFLFCAYLKNISTRPFSGEMSYILLYTLSRVGALAQIRYHNENQHYADHSQRQGQQRELSPIQIRVTQNRKSRFIGTGVTIPIDDWDSEKQLIKSNSPKSKELQLQIDKKISELNRRIKKFEVLEIEVTLDNLLETNDRKINCTIGEYRVLTLDDFSPESYIAAIDICEQAGAEVIIIDSISHCWDYLLDFHANLQGNSFANWAKVTPRQNNFIRRILSSSSHVILAAP